MHFILFCSSFFCLDGVIDCMVWCSGVFYNFDFDFDFDFFTPHIQNFGMEWNLKNVAGCIARRKGLFWRSLLHLVIYEYFSFEKEGQAEWKYLFLMRRFLFSGTE